MKGSRFSLAILAICAIFSFTSCSKNNADYIETTKEIVQQGTWSVDYYYAGQDLSTQYSGYHFVFHTNGTVTAYNNGTSYDGKWTVTHDYANREVLSFVLDTPEPHINSLNNSWTVSASTTDRVDMSATGAEVHIHRL